MAAVEYLGGKCVDCGFNDYSRLEVFEFDHLPKYEKRERLSVLFGGHSWDTIIEELDKCDLVCANCHATRTVQRLGSLRGGALASSAAS